MCGQVYKTHLTEGRAPSGPAVDSARQNLASTFVNAFVNAGFGQDKLMTVIPEGEGSSENVHWIFKNKVSLVDAHGKQWLRLNIATVLLARCNQLGCSSSGNKFAHFQDDWHRAVLHWDNIVLLPSRQLCMT